MTREEEREKLKEEWAKKLLDILGEWAITNSRNSERREWKNIYADIRNAMEQSADDILSAIDAARAGAVEECAKVGFDAVHLPALHDKQMASCDCPSDEGGREGEWCQKAVDAVCCMREQIVSAIRKLSPPAAEGARETDLNFMPRAAQELIDRNFRRINDPRKPPSTAKREGGECKHERKGE